MVIFYLLPKCTAIELWNVKQGFSSGICKEISLISFIVYYGVNPCEGNPCGYMGTCIPEGNTYRCECPVNYINDGKDCGRYI